MDWNSVVGFVWRSDCNYPVHLRQFVGTAISDAMFGYDRSNVPGTPCGDYVSNPDCQFLNRVQLAHFNR
jgi:hypothetical protein